MIFKAKIGTTFLATVVLWSLLSIMFVILSISMSSILLAIIAGLFLLAYLYFVPTLKTKTIYEITDDFLLVKSGKYELKIPYDSIQGVSHIKSMLMAPSTSSFVRIEVKYKNEKGATDFVHISPVERNDFIRLLESKVAAKSICGDCDEDGVAS